MGGERLRVVEGRAVGSDVPLEEDEFRIGRAQDGLGKLADDPEISRSHARVSRRADGALSVEDLGSTNGTFVNGARVQGARRLQPGDRIRVGQTTLEVLPEVGEGFQPTAMSALPARNISSPAPEPPRIVAVAAGSSRLPLDSLVAPKRRRPSLRLVLLAAGALALAALALFAVLALAGSDEDQPRTLGDGSRIGAGDNVVALGYPGAFEEKLDERKLKTNEGNVTSEPDAVTLGRDLPRLPLVIEHQAPINPGNSGGPLFDDRGRVIDINTVRTGNEAQSGAISVERIKQLLPDLRSGRNQGYVGWNVRVLRLQGDDSLPLVLGVDADSPGDRAGLRLSQGRLFQARVALR